MSTLTSISTVQLTTTTVFAGPTADPSASSSSSHVPVAAIAGGAAAGVALAIFAVVGWVCWGRSIARKQARERQLQQAKRAAAAYKSSVLGAEKTSKTPQLLPRSPDRSSDNLAKKVVFASQVLDTPVSPTTANGHEGAGNIEQRKSKRTTAPITPSPLAPASYQRHQSQVLRVSRRPRLAYKPEVASSSAARPEARTHTHSEPQKERNMVAPALSDSESLSSRRWSWRSLLNGPGFSFTSPRLESNRLSADTSSMGMWPEALEAPDLPIGYAYGGESEEQADFNKFAASTLQFADSKEADSH